jgi:S1-C subfamily serine protease
MTRFSLLNRLPSPARRAYGLPLLAMLLASSGLVRADSPAMSAATLRKVKQATVHLQVRVPSGTVYEGTGFFVDEPGLIVTNAHVLGMLEPNSRKPLQVDATINPGEANSKTYRGQVLGADRGTDLAVLRIAGSGLPQPLKVGTAKNVTELQEVYIFGFPFGKRLGKNITISKSSVSSLRKRPSGGLDRIQVNGGMNPGNSGGPVTDAEGNLIGVAVAVIKDSSINFAIPSDHVYEFLNGRIDYLNTSPAYRDGERIKKPLRVHLIDPLGRASKVAVEMWTGTAGKPRPETGPTEPKALPGDSAKQTVVLTYNKKTGLAVVDLVLPARSDPKQVVWIRPTVTHPAGDTYWVMAYSLGTEAPLERKPLQLKYQPGAKPMYVELASKASLRMRDDEGGEGTVRSNFRVVLREQPAAESAAGGGRLFNVKFTRVTAGIFINDKPLTGKGSTTPMLNDMVRNVTLNVEMDGDGNPTRAQANFGKTPRESRAFVTNISDQVIPSLLVLTVPLSGDTLPPLKTWKARRLLDVGPMSISLPAEADLKYTYLGFRAQGGQKEAVVGVEGMLRGQRGAGNVAGSIGGTLVLSAETGQVVAASATLKLDMDAKFKDSPLKMNGELVVNLKRGVMPPPPPPSPKKK